MNVDIAFDTTWCPACSRQIVPKRHLVPILPPAPAPQVAAPPSSPSSEKHSDAPAPTARVSRNKTGTIRARAGGLVHGTGRVKPNGAIKRSPPPQPKEQPKKQPQPEQPVAPVRHRTVIDTTPLPLYCSDECRLADLQSSTTGLDINYHPDRHSSPPLPPVPHNSFSDVSAPEESDSSCSDSVKSESSVVSTSEQQTEPYPIPRGYAALASIYDLPPCPPPPPLLRNDSEDSTSSLPVNNYESGIMMAARRIQAVLGPQPAPKRPSWSTPSVMLSTTTAWGLPAERKPIPGWTDGSDAWRASVYSFAAPRDTSIRVDESDPNHNRAYKTFVATPHRSRGVHSTMGETTPTVRSSVSETSDNRRSRSEVETLYSEFSQSLSRRSESRASVAGARRELSTSPSGSTRSLPVTSSSRRRREVPILKPGAEGRLLVPNVTMRRAPSCGPSYDVENQAAARKRSPLSRQNSEASADDEVESTARQSISYPAANEHKTEVRSWSYSDITYPMMPMPPKKEKRFVRRVVDGVERIEEEIYETTERKRLFLFPGKEVRI